MQAEKGKFSHQGMWRLKRKLFPQATDPPMAKKDSEGYLITSSFSLKQLYAKTYRDRLRQREMLPKLNDIFILKTELWKRRLEKLKKQKTPNWDEKQLNKALKSLKNNKTNDPNLMINEIFKEGCIGTDLKKALLLLVNGVKSEMKLPEFIELADIVSIYKNKGSRLDMNNDRGIFILTIFKKILDKLTYFDLYEDIDKNMLASNIGARKGRSIKNIFLLSME